MPARAQLVKLHRRLGDFDVEKSVGRGGARVSVLRYQSRSDGGISGTDERLELSCIR